MDVVVTRCVSLLFVVVCYIVCMICCCCLLISCFLCYSLRVGRCLLLVGVRWCSSDVAGCIYLMVVCLLVDACCFGAILINGCGVVLSYCCLLLLVSRRLMLLPVVSCLLPV